MTRSPYIPLIQTFGWLAENELLNQSAEPTPLSISSGILKNALQRRARILEGMSTQPHIAVSPVATILLSPISSSQNMLTPEEVTTIRDTYSWIRVPAFHPDFSDSWKEKIHKLQEHHRAECAFLVDFMRKKLNTYIPLQLISALPDTEHYTEQDYYELDAKHLKITNALIEEIRDTAVKQLADIQLIEAGSR